MTNKTDLEKAKIVSDTVKNMPIKPVEKQIAVMQTALGGNPTRFLAEALSRSQTEKAEKESAKDYMTKPSDYTELESVLHDMLTENTGTHILDSGSAYGRAWQRNRKINDFTQTPVINIEIHADHKDVLIQYNIFHYLNNFLELDETAKELQQLFNQFADKDENKDLSWFALMDKFAEHMTNYGFTQGGSWNSYNYENLLSQVIQVSDLYKNGDPYDVYIMLQIHGGCDVRGGYTAPKIFHIPDRDYFILAQNDLRACCPKCGLHWYSDDGGYHWYFDGCYNGQKTLDGDDPKYELEKTVEYIKTDQGYGKDRIVCKYCKTDIQFSVMEEF